MIRRINAGDKVHFIPGIGLSVYTPKASAIPWYLTGGIPAANCLAAWQAHNAASYAAALVNLAGNAAYNLAPQGGDMTWAPDTGFVGDGVKYFKTAITGADATWSLIARFANATTNGEALIGAATTATNARKYVFSRNSTNDGHTYGVGTAVVVSPRLTSGVMAVCGVQGYLNGVSDGAAGTWGSGTAPEIYVMATNGAALFKMNGSYWYSGAVYNIDIAAYVAALTAAMPEQFGGVAWHQRTFVFSQRHQPCRRRSVRSSTG